MALADWADAQIIAIGSAVAIVAGAIITASRQSAKSASEGSPAAHPGASFLVLDAKQVGLLIGEMGELSASLAKLGVTMAQSSEGDAENRRVLDRNTESARDLSRKADDLERAFTALTIETARRHG